MNRSARRLVSLLSAAAVVAAVAITGVITSPTTEAQTPPPPPAGRNDVRTSQQDAVTVRAPRPWTKEEMEAAKPKPIPQRSGTPSQSSLSTPGGTPGLSPASNVANLEAVEAGAPMMSAAGSGAEPQTSTYPSPFTRWQWFGKYRVFPISPVGKMFFTQYGTNYVCSAAAVGVDTIWTAGHCVHEGDNLTTGWSTNVQFCPSYDSSQGGVNPNVGCWGADFLTTSSEWYSSGNFDRDFGAINAANTGTKFSTQIGNVTSWLGFAWNWPRQQNYMAFGYPAAAPFTGGKVITCAAEFAFTENGGAGTDSQSIGCDMTPGSSGGPWIWQFGTNNYVNGLNSWKWTSRPQQMNSPYFDDTANNVRCAAGC